jgi:hypothetical protein
MFGSTDDGFAWWEIRVPCRGLLEPRQTAARRAAGYDCASPSTPRMWRMAKDRGCLIGPLCVVWAFSNEAEAASGETIS